MILRSGSGRCKHTTTTALTTTTATTTAPISSTAEIPISTAMANTNLNSIPATTTANIIPNVIIQDNPQLNINVVQNDEVRFEDAYEYEEIPTTSLGFRSGVARRIANNGVSFPSVSPNVSDTSSMSLNQTQINRNSNVYTAANNNLANLPTITATMSPYTNASSSYHPTRNSKENVRTNQAELKEYISASIGASHAAILLDVERCLNRLIPNIVTKSMDAERQRQLNHVSMSSIEALLEERRNRFVDSSNQTEQSSPIVPNERPSMPPQANFVQNYPPNSQVPLRTNYSVTVTTSISTSQAPPIISYSVSGQTPPNQHVPRNFVPVSTYQFIPPSVPASSMHNYQNPPFAIPYPMPSISRSFVPFDKWGIKFDGSSQLHTVDFLFRVEVMRRDNKCTTDDLFKNFSQLLTGKANEWFWSFRRQYPNCDFQEVKSAMIRKFKTSESDGDIYTKIVERKQKPNESIEAFIDSLTMLRNQMEFRMSEEELIRKAKVNLNSNLYWLLYPMQIRSIDQLIEEGKRAERNNSKRISEMQRNNQPNCRRVNELDFTPSDPQLEFFELEAMRMNQQNSSIVCYNCKMPGHTYYQCSTMPRKMFCFKCGLENVATPNCPKCSGNVNQSINKSAASCSTQTQTP